jgi:CheY-like chemotaxis protein
MNICINARDAMPVGGTITIETGCMPCIRMRSYYPDAEDSDYLSITIKDSGTGMTEETRLKIFEPFFTTKEPGKGTGLGLSVVYGIVESHHGRIRVQSAPGKGSEFMLFFPVNAGDRTLVPDRADVSVPKAGNGETILVIDDEMDIVEFLKEFLEFHGYKVRTANSGENGIKVFNTFSHEIALVLCDKEMPVTDGKKVFESIHAAKPEIPFLLVTGLVEPTEREALLARGMRNVLLKPVEAEELLLVVARTLNKMS